MSYKEMLSEGSKLKPGGEQLAGKQLELCRAELRAVAARRADLNGRLQLLEAQDRLLQTRLRFWEMEEELLEAKRSCDEEEEERCTREQPTRQAGAARQRVRRVEAELARALLEERDALERVEGCGPRVAAMEADLLAAETAAEEKKWELHAFAREHCRTQLLPPEMLSELMRYLSPTDRVTAAQVCSTWRELVKSDESLWRDTKLIWRTGCKPGSGKLHSCPVLAVAPYVEELCVTKWTSGFDLRKDMKIGKLILQVGGRSRDILKSIAGRLSQLSSLTLFLTNHDAARVIDSNCTALKEFSFEFASRAPYIFSRQFVKKSTLTDLRCCQAPVRTIMSIVDGHCDTLEIISISEGYQNCEPGGTIVLTTCIRLKCLQVECSFSFSLPPCCEAVHLLLRFDGRCADKSGGCAGCASLSGSGPTSLTHLRLIIKYMTVSEVEQLELHLRALSKRWLAALQTVSIHSKSPLTAAQREALESIAGRSLDFQGRRRDLDW